MAMLGCRAVGIDEPKGCKKLVVYVEMDRCATDAVQAVTGCSLGKHSLKFLDYGKMAVTFVNTETTCLTPCPNPLGDAGPWSGLIRNHSHCQDSRDIKV